MPRFEQSAAWVDTALNRLAAWVFTQRANRHYPAPSTLRAERGN